MDGTCRVSGANTTDPDGARVAVGTQKGPDRAIRPSSRARGAGCSVMMALGVALGRVLALVLVVGNRADGLADVAVVRLGRVRGIGYRITMRILVHGHGRMAGRGVAAGVLRSSGGVRDRQREGGGDQGSGDDLGHGIPRSG